MPDLRVAVDAGGTFTDVCIYNASTQAFRVTKVPSTPNNPMQAVINGVKRGEIELSNVDLFFHGTTVATNAALESKGARTVLDGIRMDYEDGWGLCRASNTSPAGRTNVASRAVFLPHFAAGISNNLRWCASYGMDG